jgi:hypothetical protein
VGNKLKLQKMYHHDKEISAKFFKDNLFHCPLCLSEFKDEGLEGGLLSIEHVPPESNGGVPLIVTCKKCNSLAGYSIDAQYHLKNTLHDEVSKVLSKSEISDVHVKIEDLLSGTTLNAVATSSPDKLNFNITKHNNPEALKQSIERIKQQVESNQTIRIKLSFRTSYDVYRADLSELRAAYLTCFALAGYCYATSSSTEKLRKQFMNPKQKIFTPISEASTSDKKFVVYTESYDIFMVCFNGRKWLLPGLNSTDGYDKILRLIFDGEVVELEGIQMKWPKRLMAITDKYLRMQNV